jgi:hypothetical protein
VTDGDGIITIATSLPALAISRMSTCNLSVALCVLLNQERTLLVTSLDNCTIGMQISGIIPYLGKLFSLCFIKYVITLHVCSLKSSIS